jgi:antirestriction protein ArdC
MNVYAVITERILEALANGVVPWRKPWQTEAPQNLITRREYHGVNVFLLQSQPFESRFWLTYNQARSLGGTVKRGERGTPIVFWKITERDDDEAETRKGFVLRYFTVFNILQTEGIEVPKTAVRPPFNPIEACERIVRTYAEPPRIEHGGERACYVPSQDRIHMPTRADFPRAEEYYSTLFHELAHSTGASHRLARKGIIDPTRFESHDYSFEELVAECCSAFLAAHAGISPATLENSAAYIASWAKKLRSEPRWIVDAAAQASKAADLILGRLPVRKESEPRVAQAA